MEKFEMIDEKTPQVFNSFVVKAKDAFSTLTLDIKDTIKKYEQAIEDTSKEIADTESSREKCEHEITKMESKIDSIKETIENVESTYKKMVDAYSSTSKGETKELYSEIIDGAKANCEKDVEKNRSEIARLNSDIEAIKNNIAEFTKIIDGLNRDLEGYRLELFKYTTAYEYLDKSFSKTSGDLEEISVKKEEPKKKSEAKTTKKAAAKKEEEEPLVEEEIEEEAEEIVFDEPEEEKQEFEPELPGEDDEPAFDLEEPKETPVEDAPSAKEEPVKEVKKEEPIKEVEAPKEETVPQSEPVSFEDSLKQIYDLTGYKPKKEEPVKEETPVYNDNLDNLFNNSNPSNDIKPEEKKVSSYDESDMSEWERILNGADDIFTNLSPTPENTKEEVKPEANPESEVKKTIRENMIDTTDQLLKPYGTTYAALSSLAGSKITYKDGRSIPFTMSEEDVIKAVNAVDSSDLKMMKTVGPEITLLRKLKAMKEGKM